MNDTISSSASPAAQSRSSTVQFSGAAWEYSKLWYVNLFLSIITLGIYSAWAKVRNTQYMYGHTQVDEHRFNYLAKPLQILKGRIIAVVLFAAYSVIAGISPVAGVLLALLLVIATPWLVIQGLRFTYRMTAYRNVRFDFTGSYGDAIIYMILLPIMAAFTLYLAFPWALKRIDQFLLENITFGGKKFSVSTNTSKYYIAAAGAVGASIVVIVCFFLLGGAQLSAWDPQDATSAFSSFFILLLFALFLIGNYLIRAVYQAIVYNHIMSSLEVDELASFKSNLTVSGLAWVMVSNAVILIMTLGLAFPVTRIRYTQYITRVTEVTVTPAIDDLANTVQTSDSALGEEAGHIFDTDVSII